VRYVVVFGCPFVVEFRGLQPGQELRGHRVVVSGTRLTIGPVLARVTCFTAARPTSIVVGAVRDEAADGPSVGTPAMTANSIGVRSQLNRRAARRPVSDLTKTFPAKPTLLVEACP